MADCKATVVFWDVGSLLEWPIARSRASSLRCGWCILLRAICKAMLRVRSCVGLCCRIHVLFEAVLRHVFRPIFGVIKKASFELHQAVPPLSVACCSFGRNHKILFSILLRNALSSHSCYALRHASQVRLAVSHLATFSHVFRRYLSALWLHFWCHFLEPFLGSGLAVLLSLL